MIQEGRSIDSSEVEMETKEGGDVRGNRRKGDGGPPERGAHTPARVSIVPRGRDEENIPSREKNFSAGAREGGRGGT